MALSKNKRIDYKARFKIPLKLKKKMKIIQLKRKANKLKKR